MIFVKRAPQFPNDLLGIEAAAGLLTPNQPTDAKDTKTTRRTQESSRKTLIGFFCVLCETFAFFASGCLMVQAPKKLLSLSVQLSVLGECLPPPLRSDSSNSFSSLRWCSVSLTGVSMLMWQYKSPG